MLGCPVGKEGRIKGDRIFMGSFTYLYMGCCILGLFYDKKPTDPITFDPSTSERDIQVGLSEKNQPNKGSTRWAPEPIVINGLLMSL